jgi:Beta-ketoacyl synthase, N-terminal domain
LKYPIARFRSSIKLPAMIRRDIDPLVEPIAIVGLGEGFVDGYAPSSDVTLGCRLPGQVTSPSKLWELLENGRSAQSKVPKNRFNVDSWYHPDPHRKGSAASKGGYFLSHDDEFRNFDPFFFGINPLEAASLDPQQRKLLEVVYEAFESAGATLKQVSGSLTACYVGAYTIDYGRTLAKDCENPVPYSHTVNFQPVDCCLSPNSYCCCEGRRLDCHQQPNQLRFRFERAKVGLPGCQMAFCDNSLMVIHI